ncbi:hypothetical protein GQS_07995 [Thermococcus sp. 4557]|uniref:hypothetical protein n=1 Tax=Thermococcus sp. (strain CGMCC 1.5172 / 4557) TaxID=1042877 RepID=UPI000219ED1B|nr:hypothetical protein [Thermococcus sp. 4557]AEK73495.1 hypothetical protein GQS_07995 [Thermococcus sp. 4557]
MRKTVALILALLTVSATTHPVHSLPYWLKEGTHIKYVTKMPEHPGKHEVNVFPVWPLLLPKDAYAKIKEAYEGTSGLVKMDNNSIVPLLVRGDSYLTFEILNVTNETALVRVTLEMNNVSVSPEETLPRLVLSKVLHLNLSDMTYYEEDGTPIGPPTFFIDPTNPPRKGEQILSRAFMKKYRLLGDDIVLTNVSFTWMEDKILHTHYRDFLPPYLYVEGRSKYLVYDLSTGGRVETITQLVYDIDTGILITTLFCDVTPELISLGVIDSSPLDRVNSRKLERLLKEGKDDREWWAQGFNLYDTNIKLPDYGSGHSPSTPVKYFFVLSLVVLAMTALWTERRWKR